MDNFINEYFSGLLQPALQYLWTTYDYCYLKAMHEKNRNVGCKTIIAGSSHAMNGIVETELPGSVINFSISSQDVYFDYLNVKRAVEEGKQRIENCIINIGYYMLYQDLSLSKTLGYLMSDVYGPLFGDVHNYTGEIVPAADGMDSGDWKQQLYMDFAHRYFERESSYYGELKAREQNNRLLANGVIWQKLTEEEKESYAIERTADHNRLKKHQASRDENGRIVREMVEYLHGKGMKPMFVIFPFTRLYNKYIDPDYKKDIFGLLDSLPLEVEFLDMNDFPDMFADGDFLDTDHLNLQGARKATRLLGSFMARAGNHDDGIGESL